MCLKRMILDRLGGRGYTKSLPKQSPSCPERESEQKMTEKTNDADRPDRPDLPRNEFEALHAFQGVMWEKLRANAHKGGWSQDPPHRLLERLRGELKELEKALTEWERAELGTIVITDQAEALAKEAADVANFAMMIADVTGGLKYKRVG